MMRKQPLLVVALTVVVAVVLLKYMSQQENNNIVSNQSILQTAETVSKHQRVVLNQTDLSCLKADGPQPTILLSRGRSGSSAVWQVLGNITGLETNSDEYTGQTSAGSRDFFLQHRGTKWLINRLCRDQRQHPAAGIVGFKWKPYGTAIYAESAKAGLRLIAALQDAQPNIKVVHNKRNSLDMLLSQLKHGLSPKVGAHCLRGDAECVKQSQKAGTGIHLPVDKLVQKLERVESWDTEVEEYLAELGVPLVNVSYEKLFFSDSVDEWKRIIDFLGVPLQLNGRELKRRDIRRAGSFTVTTNRNHRESIQNYDEVANVLKGTKFEQLLH